MVVAEIEILNNKYFTTSGGPGGSVVECLASGHEFSSPSRQFIH